MYAGTQENIQHFVVGDFAADAAREYLNMQLRTKALPVINEKNWANVYEV